MSRERELLYRWYRGARDQVDYDELYDKTEELLAQPETEQEPVAWCQLIDGKVQDLLTSFEMKDWINDDTWTALYTTPPKRELLTGSEISQGFRADKDATNAESYWAGVALAEKHYGIGIDDE